MKDEYYPIMDIIFERHKDCLSYEDCYDIARDIDEKIFSNRLEKLVMQKTAEIKGMEVNVSSYSGICNMKIRVNEHIPVDEIWVCYADKTCQKFKIV